MSEDIERNPLLRLWALLYTKIHWTYSIAGTVIRYTFFINLSIVIFLDKVMVNIPREDTMRPCTRFQPRLEEVVAANADFL